MPHVCFLCCQPQQWQFFSAQSDLTTTGGRCNHLFTTNNPTYWSDKPIIELASMLLELCVNSIKKECTTIWSVAWIVKKLACHLVAPPSNLIVTYCIFLDLRCSRTSLSTHAASLGIHDSVSVVADGLSILFPCDMPHTASPERTQNLVRCET